MIDPSFLRKKNYKWRFPVLALLFHIAVLGALVMMEIHFRREMIKDEIKKILEVKQITQEELDTLMSRRRTVETNWASDPNMAKKTGQKAFLGEKTQRVNKETIAVGKIKSGQANPMKLTAKDLGAQRLVDKKGFGAKLTGDDKSKRNTGPSFDVISLDPTLSISPRTFLNTDSFVYASFSNRLREIIGIPWAERTTKIFQSKQSEFGIGIYVTTAKYFFTPEGKITSVSLTRASGMAELDKAAVDSIYAAKIIQNPPPYLFKPPFNGSLEFSFYFYVVPGRNFYFNYFPDDRLDKVR